MKQYTQEYIDYVHKYPYEVHEDFLNGIKNDILFSNKTDALNYMEKAKIKTPRARLSLIHKELNPEYMPQSQVKPILNCNGEPITGISFVEFSR